MDEDDFQDVKVDFDSSEEDCTGRSKNFTSPVPVAPSTPVANFVSGRSVPPPACATPLPPGDRHVVVDATIRGFEPLPSTWRNLFANNRNMLVAHYSEFTETNGCNV
ncbi:hypothetical protein OIU79_000547 [Salix purpurea]|uniref:Uncharacterized protein n=1 Tax=Salix purpurea TaxID=77065 RepID=A0A9Q0ZMV1_SALPP|nr:hypothetical protein OIU79_000547 [Salix purpurea]